MTCEAVLAETAFHLNDSALVLGMLDMGLVRMAFDLESHRAELAHLARRYADRHPDLADLCLPFHSSRLRRSSRRLIEVGFLR